MPKIIKPKIIYVSDELLSKFTKVDLGNIKEFFEADTLFLSIGSIGKGNPKNILISQFNTRSKFIKDSKIKHYFFSNNQVLLDEVNIYSSESDEDYNWAMDDMKVIIKDLIKKNMLYGRKF